ncbi:MAG TPA: trypsin-like peptidase domain-containing protein [Candidatus Acidoferrum sp.]|nr:trypsin-like peptidase domain-containing protein [Candidatus Acidoferrum sp.]
MVESKILIKNIGKPKGGTTETFASGQYAELTIGRDPACDIKFDPNDDLVSRRHSKITKVSDAPDYTIADLGSRNGTLVNKRRIFEPTKLNCGDLIQLGPDGPQFEFDLDPRPASMIKPTRLSDATLEPGGTAKLPPTRQTAAPMMTTREAPPSPTAGAPSAPAGVGKATVERMIADTKTKSQNMAIVAVAAILLVLGGVTAWLYTTRSKTIIVAPPPGKNAGDLSPAEIAGAYTESTVFFEVGWKLIYTDSGKELYHVLIPNKRLVPGKKDVYEEILPNADEYLPAFFKDDDDTLQPWLSTDDKTADKKHDNQPIGGRHSGSGFVVSNDGYIITNRHVAAAWFTDYEFPSRYGILIGVDASGHLVLKPIDLSLIRTWVPAYAKVVTTSAENLATLQQLPKFMPRGKNFEGRNDYLDVTFAKNRIRIPAKLVRISDRNDVAMVKVDTPETLKKIELNDNYDTIKVGDQVVTLGYPGVSGAVYGVAASHDILAQQASVREVPDPTLSVGNVGRILRGATGSDEAKVFAGDYYQLTINSTGAGNSGGPVIDTKGRVVAIFTLGIKRDVQISGAVPIRYGMELMSVKPMEAK